MNEYKPGLHLLGTLTTASGMLREMDACKQLFDALIREHGLCKVGEVYHQFDTGGFTASVALTESHLSIHTWPEYGLATYDIYLSNFRRDNEDKVRAIHQATCALFCAETVTTEELYR